MKKYISISLFVFFTTIVIILVGSVIFTSTPASKTTQPVTTPLSGVTLAELSKHNNVSDCWQAINGEVYNLTSFLSQHPAGENIMIPYCGQEATQAYDTEGGRGRSHSARAQSMLASYLVGPLN